MQADAAAALDDDLDDATAVPVARSSRDVASTEARTPSQVYSIRVPVERLEQLRRLARERNVAPTTMLRQWVLTQLDAELEREEPASHSQRAEASARNPVPQSTSRQRHDAYAERLDAATTALTEATSLLTRSLSLIQEIIDDRPLVAQSLTALLERAFARSQSRRITAGLLPDLWLVASGVHPDPRQPSIDYLDAGLAALQSTIKEASSMPGLAGNDLESLYEAADEELSTS
jgi:hypothetical protein